jgi:integrase
MTLREFLDSRRSDDTRRVYRQEMRLWCDDPDRFAREAARDPKKAEDEIIRKVVALRKKKLSPATTNLRLAALRSFLEYEGVRLNWKRIRSVAPAQRTAAHDRAPTTAEIGKLLEVADLREKAVILVLLSSGCRVGALPGMRLSDLEFLDGGIGRLRVYRGEAEEYHTFVTTEAAEAVQAYLEARRRTGERLKPESPLFRDAWDFHWDGVPAKIKAQRVAPDIAHPIERSALQTTVTWLWKKAGVRSAGDGRPFKSLHGFRKFFKTSFPASACALHGQNDVEVLMGHFLSYHKPAPEHLEEVYRRALPALLIDEKHRLKTEMKQKEMESAEQWQGTRLELLEQKERVNELTRRLDELFPLVEELSKRALARDQSLVKSPATLGQREGTGPGEEANRGNEDAGNRR